MDSNRENGSSTDVDDSHSFVESELEALQSIYINELEIKHNEDRKGTCVLIDLHPSTADKQEEQYVKMTLEFNLNEDYPHAVPQISIHNPRGLSEEKINSTYQDLLLIADNKIGSSMLFEIIEAAKERLTAENRPSGECAICLYGFSSCDVFTRTDCYHYFHSHCLARYAQSTTEEEVLLCPMCRVPIRPPAGDGGPPPAEAEDGGGAAVVGEEELRELRGKMAALYQRQLERGGIIDLEAERNKFLLEISNVPTSFTPLEKSEGVDEAKVPEEEPPTSSEPPDDKNRLNEAPRGYSHGRRGGRYPRRRYPRHQENRSSFNKEDAFPPRRHYPRHQEGQSSPNKDEALPPRRHYPKNRESQYSSNKVEALPPRRHYPKDREGQSSSNKEEALPPRRHYPRHQEDRSSSNQDEPLPPRRHYPRHKEGQPSPNKDEALPPRRHYPKDREGQSSSNQDEPLPPRRHQEGQSSPNREEALPPHSDYKRRFHRENGGPSEGAVNDETANRGRYHRGNRYHRYGENSQNSRGVRRNPRHDGNQERRGFHRRGPPEKSESSEGAANGGGAVEERKPPVRPPPGFHNPNKKVVYGVESFSAPPGFPRR